MSKCASAFLGLHITSSGSGYFEVGSHILAAFALLTQLHSLERLGLECGIVILFWFPQILTSHADHDLDDAAESKLNVFSGRGVLVESRGPVWLVGTASEHHVSARFRFLSRFFLIRHRSFINTRSTTLETFGRASCRRKLPTSNPPLIRPHRLQLTLNTATLQVLAKTPGVW